MVEQTARNQAAVEREHKSSKKRTSAAKSHFYQSFRDCMGDKNNSKEKHTRLAERTQKNEEELLSFYAFVLKT